MVNLKFKNGFTLVEALAILAIAAIILAAATPVITKKHKKPPAPVIHGRFECWWDGNQLKQRTIFGERIVEEKNVSGSCKFDPPKNVDKFLVQAIGGGGAGGGSGDSFIRSRTQENEGATFIAMHKLNDGTKSVESSPTNGTHNWPVKPGRFIKESDLRKKPYTPESAKKTALNWFEWDYLDTRKNSKAYNFVAVACSSKGGDGGTTKWSDALPYWCIENEVRATATSTLTHCNSCGSGCNGSPTPGNGCDCGTKPDTCCTGSGENETCSPCRTSCSDVPKYWRYDCNPGGYYARCHENCVGEYQRSATNPCSGQLNATNGYGSSLLIDYRNSSQRTYTVAGGIGAPAKCVSTQTNIVHTLEAKFTPPPKALGADGKTAPICPLAANDHRCPAWGGEDGKDAEANVTSANFSKTIKVNAKDTGAMAADVDSDTRIQSALVNIINGLVNDAWDNRYGIPINDWRLENLDQKYACAAVQGTPVGANGKPAKTTDSCVSGYCSTGVAGPNNHEYGWSRTYYTQWLNYGEAGAPGNLVSTYVSKIHNELTITPGKGGDTGNWSKNTVEANGKDGTSTTVRLGFKTLVSANGGKGGEGAIQTDEYTLCSNGMHRTQPELCSTLVAGKPQRKLEGGTRNSTGLEKFHAAFDMKSTTGLGRLKDADSFGIGGAGQGSKSLCDSAEDLRRVWNVQKKGSYVYDNSRDWAPTNTQASDYQAKCSSDNRYYMPNLSDTQLGTAYNRTADYAPERGGDGAVIITW